MTEMPEKIWINKDPYGWGMYGCSHSPIEVKGSNEYTRSDTIREPQELVEALRWFVKAIDEDNTNISDWDENVKISRKALADWENGKQQTGVRDGKH